MALGLGMDAVLSYKIGGVGGGGSFVEMGNVKDVTLGLEKGETDVTTRANNGWRARKGTLKDATLEFEMQWDTEDDGFTAVKDAFLNNEAIGFEVLDRESGEGLRADFDIIEFSRAEPLEEAITVSVTARPTYSSTPPEWIEAA